MGLNLKTFAFVVGTIVVAGIVASIVSKMMDRATSAKKPVSSSSTAAATEAGH